MNKKRLASSAAAVGLAFAILLGGTFAWQSVSQTALNEASDIVNPGGRLHDDFNGENKDIYVENFADEPIFVRVRLGEYFALTLNKNIEGAERENVLLGGLDEASGERVYDIRYFHEPDSAEEYWTWKTGGSTVYMPTFNMNKDSLIADVNGTYAGPDGQIEHPNVDRYQDYESYAEGERRTGTVILDADANNVDEVGEALDDLTDYINTGSISVVEKVEHVARKTADAELISMSEWLAMVNGSYDTTDHGNYWVYDTDGWVYWSAPIMPNSATGLLLDGIDLAQVMDDSWYYAIQVTAQFVTADDIGKDDHSGFYDEDAGSVPTASAEQLLRFITDQPL